MLRKLYGIGWGGCERLSENKEVEVNEEQESSEIISDTGSSFEDNGFSDQLSDLNNVQGAWRSPRLRRMVKDSPRLLRKAISKMTNPMVTRRRMADEVDDEQESSEIVNDVGITFEHNGLLLQQEKTCSEKFSEINYVPRAWRSPCLRRRVVDSVRNMSKMTSPQVFRRKNEDEIFIITLDVVHSSGRIGKGEGRADAW